jgi:signal transduction histidine kinase
MEDTKIFIDGSRVESVLASIVKNTMEAIVEKGTIKIWSIQKESTTEISVTDSGGGGIPQKVLPKIFAPLVTTKAKGMGMSLAICKRIAEAHGGKITVETKMGIGTTVTIVLPSNLSKNEYAHTSDFYVDLNQKVPLPSTRENKP